jgi:urocanate hydratase
MENSERVSAQTPAIADQLALVIAYELFSAAAEKYFDATLAGRFAAGCGMDQFGGAQALAAPMNGAAFLGVDANPNKIKQRVKSGYCDVMVNDLDEALRILKNAVRKGEATSVGLTGNCTDIVATMAKRGVVPDLLIDTTENDSVAASIDGILALQELGSKVFAWRDTRRAPSSSVNAGNIADGSSEFLAPMLAEGFAAVYCAAQSGQAADIRRIDALAFELFSHDEPLVRWIRLVQKRTRLQDPPARAYWLSRKQQITLREAVSDLAARGELKSRVTLGEYLFNSAP